MNTFRTDINAWLRTQAHVISGRPFPYGDFSCVPLASDEPEATESPIGFLLSKGTEITIITPREDGEDTGLWDHLIEEMAHWHAFPTDYKVLPPECWYG